jgi:peptidoglycan/LPS O-acetylase OafA/YrhL
MQRIKELDSIRGLAAITIMVYHLWLNEIGALGQAINLFFILSGYLITSIILNNELTDRFLLAFYARRCLRIWPIYYLTLLLLVVVNPLLPLRENLADLPYYLTYTQEITHYWSGRDPSFPHAFRHTWTLAIEEQFYLFWPALLFFVGRARIPLVASILIGLAVIARALDLNHFILITQCDGLALGGLLAYLLVGKYRGQLLSPSTRARFTALGFATSGLLIAILLLANRIGAQRPEFIPPAALKSLMLLVANLLLFTTIAAVVLNAGNPWLGWLRDRRLVYLGTISYGLYLYHQFLFRIWENFAVYHGWSGGLLTDLAKFGCSVAMASLSWHFLERPILALKDRFAYRAAVPLPNTVPPKVNELGRVEMG